MVAKYSTLPEKSRLVLEIHAGRTGKLTDDDALRAVDDKRAFVGHQRQVAEIHFAFDLFFAGLPQQHFGLNGRLEGHIPVAALFHAVFGFAKRETGQRNGSIAGEIINR